MASTPLTSIIIWAGQSNLNNTAIGSFVSAISMQSNAQMSYLKKHIVVAALLASFALVPLSASSFIEQSRNISELNTGNINANKTYTLPPAPQSALNFDFKLKGYVFGLRMIRANYTGWFDQTNYNLYTDLKTSGLGALLKKLEIWAVTQGRYSSARLQPNWHIQQNLDKKNRRVEMNYNNLTQAVDVNIRPPLGSQGTPPASPQERYAAHDTLSAILNFMMRGQKIDKPMCSGSVSVFDSKQHYNLRLVRDGMKSLKFNGEKSQTVRCLIYYEPISGFDPEDLPDPEEGSTPIKAYLKPFPELGLNIPIRFTYKISSIKAVIKLDELSVKLPNASQSETFSK